MALSPTPDEIDRRANVVKSILEHVRTDTRIKLPEFDVLLEGATFRGRADLALLALPDNEFSGLVGPYRYQFEGEDDLLHIAVFRPDRLECSVEEAQEVISFLIPQVSPALIWLRPGTLSQHFYVGHDELL